MRFLEILNEADYSSAEKILEQIKNNSLRINGLSPKTILSKGDDYLLSFINNILKKSQEYKVPVNTVLPIIFKKELNNPNFSFDPYYYFYKYKDSPAFKSIRNEFITTDMRPKDFEHECSRLINNKTSKQLEKTSINDNDISVLYDKNGWKLQVPKNFQASCKIASSLKKGKKASWCTAADKRYYDRYTENGKYPLFIVSNGEDGWQFCVGGEEVDYKDFNDEDFKLTEFMDKAPDELLSLIKNKKGSLLDLKNLFDKKEITLNKKKSLNNTIKYNQVISLDDIHSSNFEKSSFYTFFKNKGDLVSKRYFNKNGKIFTPANSLENFNNLYYNFTPKEVEAIQDDNSKERYINSYRNVIRDRDKHGTLNLTNSEIENNASLKNMIDTIISTMTNNYIKNSYYSVVLYPIVSDYNQNYGLTIKKNDYRYDDTLSGLRRKLGKEYYKILMDSISKKYKNYKEIIRKQLTDSELSRGTKRIASGKIKKMLYSESHLNHLVDLLEENLLLEFVSYKEGHKNSKGEEAPWVIISHKDGHIISSHKTEKEAKNHLRQIEYFKHRG